MVNIWLWENYNAEMVLVQLLVISRINGYFRQAGLDTHVTLA